MRAFLQMLKCIVVYRLKNIRFPTTYGKEEEITIMEKSSDVSEKEIIPKLAWVYWHDPIPPFFIQKCISHNKRMLPTYDFRILNKDSVLEYLPKLKFSEDTLITHQSDVIRLELLSKFGGVWLDATVILGTNLNWLEQISAERKFDIIAYYRACSTVDPAFPVIETWFIASPPQNKFIQAWRDEFGKIKKLGGKGYYDKLTAREDYDIIKQGLSRPSYLMLNMAEQIVSRSLIGINAYLKKCEDSAFYVQEALGWDNYAINFAFTQIKAPPSFKLIKLTSGDRMLVDFIRYFGLLNKKSLVGQIMKGPMEYHQSN